jgi:hypothetical protein
MHPFARARERTRALNAAKMDRIFAKPFVAALEGHMDAVESMAKQPDSLVHVASGSWGGGTSSTRGRPSYGTDQQTCTTHMSDTLQMSSFTTCPPEELPQKCPMLTKAKSLESVMPRRIDS